VILAVLGTVRSAPHAWEMAMSLIGWIVLGLIAGFIASKIVNRAGEGALLDIILGVIGAVVGGWLFHTFGMPGVTGFNLYSMLVAIIGAVVVLVLYHMIADSHLR
jgi:uncharacterized membrane protein YeaQ/YmgE (transglycosylase-associated protein family)